MYYLDMLKGRLYTCAAKSADRRAAQTACFEVLNCLVRMMAPILIFTSEEIFRCMPKTARDKEIESVHLLDWPKADPRFSDKVLGEELQSVIALIPDVAKALEEKRCAGIIGSSFDAKINLLTKSQVRYKFLAGLKEDLLEIFKVSQVEVRNEPDLEAYPFKSSTFSDIALDVSKAPGEKCVRCWNYSDSVGQDTQHSLICGKCINALGGK